LGAAFVAVAGWFPLAPEAAPPLNAALVIAPVFPGHAFGCCGWFTAETAGEAELEFDTIES
jgi:hypothetical protein